MSIKFTVTGGSGNTERFLQKIATGNIIPSLETYAQRGVDALRSATPRNSGLTADSWSYEIVKSKDNVTIWWKNSNTSNGYNVAIGLQYGHGTGSGGYVAGRDFINPVLRPIFDEIANEAWKAVGSA